MVDRAQSTNYNYSPTVYVMWKFHYVTDEFSPTVYVVLKILFNKKKKKYGWIFTTTHGKTVKATYDETHPRNKTKEYAGSR